MRSKNKIACLITICSALLATPSFAQLEKGNLMVGGGLISSGMNFQKSNTSFDISLTPKIGYFLQQNLVVGASLELGADVQKANTTFTYDVTPFLRYFITNKDVKDMPKSLVPFLEAGGGFGGRNTRYEDTDGNKTTVTSNGGLFYVQPGLAWFLSRNVALELALQYKYINASPDVNRIGLNLGFQLFLTRNQAKNQYNETKSELDKISQ